MNEVSRLLLFCLFVCGIISCSKQDAIQHGCSIRASENVFKGQFDVTEIDYIGIIHDVSQKSLHPVPDWENSNNLIVVRNTVFFDQFKRAVIGAGWGNKPSPVIHINGNVQIIVSFKNGPGAYLFCRPMKHALAISPMFENDSYGVTSESLFDLINDELAKTKHAIFQD